MASFFSPVGNNVIEISSSFTADNMKARDKRSGLVDRHKAHKQVLCYICCGKVSTQNLNIFTNNSFKKYRTI